MRKLVNGKVVDIPNIELFELGMQGLAMQNAAYSTTSDGIDSSFEATKAKKYLKIYDVFFKSMPYPMYAIEEDVKYATLGTFIKALTMTKDSMWIRHGLHIKLSDITGIALHIVNNTWSIEYVNQDYEDNTSIEFYSNSVGYKEYKWIVHKILNKENTSGFYATFMPEFVKACNNNPMVLKWELENILKFAEIPKEKQLKENRLLDVVGDCEYEFKISNSEKVKIPSKNINVSKNSTVTDDNDVINIYDYELYRYTVEDGIEVPKLCDKNIKVGMKNIFKDICNYKNAYKHSSSVKYKGIIINKVTVYMVCNRLYVSRVDKPCKRDEIAYNVELYSYDTESVFFIKKEKVTDVIIKSVMYKYDIRDNKIRLCGISFTY